MIGAEKVRGRVAIISDDMIDTAGTLCAGAEAVKRAGAARVIACATHPIFSPPALERITNSVLDQVVVSDTVPRRSGHPAAEGDRAAGRRHPRADDRQHLPRGLRVGDLRRREPAVLGARAAAAVSSGQPHRLPGMLSTDPPARRPHPPRRGGRDARRRGARRPGRRRPRRRRRPPVVHRSRAARAVGHLPHRVADQAGHRRGDHDAGRGGRAASRRARSRACCRSLPTAGCCARSTPSSTTRSRPSGRSRVEDLLSFRFGFGSVMAPPGSHPIQRAESECGLRSIGGPPWPPIAHDAGLVDGRPRFAAAHVPAGRAVALQHLGSGARRARCPGHGCRPRVGAARAHLRSARHGRHRLHRAGARARPADDVLRHRS